MSDLLSIDTHFEFGKNWRSFAKLIDEPRMEGSDATMRDLFPDGELAGRTCIDIGCGSGLPALSMLRLGAKHVTCIDIDPNSVETTRKTLMTHAPKDAWTANVTSVFDHSGKYDVVYSWGVLHHTGDMWSAINAAEAMVKDEGILCIAIYHKTALCWWWKIEKRFYTNAPEWWRAFSRACFIAIAKVGYALKGRDPDKEDLRRGMSWRHDVHDWLGGFPYESASLAEIRKYMAVKGYVKIREIPTFQVIGVFGTGCDEYVYRKA